MNNSFIEQARTFVEEECHKPTSHYSEIFENHLIPMRNLAVDLGERLGADVEVVELAAWFHDIGGILFGRENHHQTGAKIAEKKLREWEYPEEKIMCVVHCILTHRGSQNLLPETLEAQIILEADSMSNFDNLPGIFKAAYVDEGLTQPEAKKSAREKLARKWHKLQFAESKQLIQPKYEAAMLLLS